VESSPVSSEHPEIRETQLMWTGYIRTLELTLTWLFQQNPESEAVLIRKLASEGNSSVLLSRDSKESNKLHKSWRRSRFCKDVDKVLSGAQLQPGDETSPVSDDEESDLEVEVTSQTFHLPPILSPDPVSSDAIFALPRPVTLARPSSGTCRHLKTSDSQIVPSGEAIPLPVDSWRLLDIYFAYTQSWLPICEKHDLLRTSYSYPEEGRVLTKDLLDSGDHAELWSVMVVAAHQARLHRTHTEIPTDIEWMYGIARGLIPTESGSFDIGHIKALLNLAVVNVGQGRNQIAWLLVGSASRLITLLEQDSQARWRHVVAGSFLLDSLLSLRLKGPPYLRRSNVGSLEEDGLEEWQPWNSPLRSSSAPHSRTPVLGLSCFNKLMDITDLLASSTSNSEPSRRQLLSRLTSWKASLPTMFDYITDERKATPPNPPALLLQLTYISSQFTLNHSPAHIGSTVDLLERFRGQLGLSALPPITICLLEYMQMNIAYITVEQSLQERLQKIVTEIKHAWMAPCFEAHVGAHLTARTQARLSMGADQAPTPESIQIPFSAFAPLSNRSPSSQHRGSTSLLENLLPDTNQATSTVPLLANLQNFSLPPLGNAFHRPAQHQNNFAAPPDLEMFFDELASLDGAEKVDNQPQFMQNLGFASDASMADFLAAEFTSPTTFTPQYSDDPSRLNPEFFRAT